MRLSIPRDAEFTGILNSIHWLFDGTVFSVGSLDCVHFWDSCTGQLIETVKLRTAILNHIYAASKFSKNKFVAGKFKSLNYIYVYISNLYTYKINYGCYVKVQLGLYILIFLEHF